MFEKLLAKLFGEGLVKKIVGSIVRTGLAGLAGFLLAKGIPPEIVAQLKAAAPAIEQFAVEIAVAIYLLVQGWSIKEKASKVEK